MICQKCNTDFLNIRSLSNHQKKCLYNQDNNFSKLQDANKKRYQLLHSNYYNNPKKCKQCENVISFKDRKNPFCGQSCAAIYNNTRRVRLKTFISCLYCNKQVRIYPHQKDIAKFCSSKCCGDYKSNTAHKNDIIRFENGDLKYRRTIRKFLVEKTGDKCSVCNLDKWGNQKITLWVDHIDGNAGNNIPSNLRLICPNCDSLNDTFGGKNYGKGRKSRGLKPWQ